MKTRTTKKITVFASLVVAGLLGFGAYGATAPAKVEAASADYVSAYRADASDAATALKNADKLNQKLEEEGAVLIKNDNDTLPLKTGLKISVFGKNSINPFYTGAGSASGADGGGQQGVKSYTFLDGLENAGFTVNPDLVSFYNSSASGQGRNGGGGTGQVATRTGETPVSSYSASLKSTFANYNDAAIIFLARAGGEGADLRTNYTSAETGRTNLASRNHPEEGDHYLELDDNEKDMIEMVKQNFSKVIVLLNMGTSFELGSMKADTGIDSIMWVGYPGGSGFNSVGKLLNGEATPSGRLADTWAADFKADPTFANFGSNYTYSTTGAGTISTVEYDEGIYVGYRYYETRGYTENDNCAWYDANVVYPFGYGMSYTTFSKSVKFTTETIEAGGDIKADVTITNTGKYPGKEVIQMYFSAPYTDGEIEKSHVVLGGFEKTKLLQPGESQTVTVSMKVREMASYDYNDANANGFTGYELDPGTYTVYVGDNAHAWHAGDAWGTKTYNLADGSTYTTDDKTGTEIKNRFDLESNYFDENATGPWANHSHTMSRSDFEGTFPQPPTTAERTITSEENQMATFSGSASASYDAGKPWYTSDMPTYENGRRNVSATRLVGLAYEDARWDNFMNQLTYNEMAGLVMHGFFQTDPIADLDVPRSITPDGPTGFVGGSSRKWVSGTCTYASPIVVASTWNKELALEMGKCVGDESIWGGDNNSTSSSAYAYPGGYNGWYAPGNNIHRSPFSGRNFEYYSEDPFLAGTICAQVVKGAESKGVFCMMKHFALNDQETSRGNLATWATEQTMREIYLRSFEIAVKEGGATGMMSAFNRIGPEWAGFSYPLLTEILRDEWGFRGVVVTDWVNGFMIADYMVRAGNDTWLAEGNVTAITNLERTPTRVAAVKRAAKSVLYAVVNSNAMNRLGTRYFTEHYTGSNFYVNLGSKAAGESVSYNAYSNAYGNKFKYALNNAPKGITINENTGEISGTIAADAAGGSYEMTVSLKDDGGYVGQNIRLRLTVTGNGIAYKGKTQAKATIGKFNRIDVSSEYMGQNVSYSVEGTLPEGLALSADGAIIGTPTTAGTSEVTVIAKASGASDLRTTVAITTAEAADISYAGGALAAGKVGEAYTANAGTATGTDGITYAASGMPAGLAMAADGAITGTPTEAGNYTVTVTASAEDCAPKTATFTIAIAAADPEPGTPTSTEPPTSTTPATSTTPDSSKPAGGCGGAIGIGAGIFSIVTLIGAAMIVRRKED